MVPEGWERATVGRVFDVQLGKMLNKVAKKSTPQFAYLGNTNVKKYKQYKWGIRKMSTRATRILDPKMSQDLVGARHRYLRPDRVGVDRSGNDKVADPARNIGSPEADPSPPS